MTDVLPRGRFNYALVRNAHRVTGAVDPLTGHLSFPRSNKRILCCFSVLWFLIAPLLRVGLRVHSGLYPAARSRLGTARRAVLDSQIAGSTATFRPLAVQAGRDHATQRQPTSGSMCIERN